MIPSSHSSRLEPSLCVLEMHSIPDQRYLQRRALFAFTHPIKKSPKVFKNVARYKNKNHDISIKLGLPVLVWVNFSCFETIKVL
jgi:hypothetical protein